MVARLLLAHRRRACLGEPGPDRRRGARLWPHAGRRPSLHHDAGGTTGRRCRVRPARLRGCFLLPLARAATAGEPRSPQEQSRRPRRAAPSDPGLRSRSEPGRILRPAAQGTGGAGRRGRMQAAAGGSATAGNCAAGTSSFCLATRRWAFACHSGRCPGPARRISSPSSSSILSLPGRRFPLVSPSPRGGKRSRP